jgi:tRNA nucleotidyltransferase/poly(A) polymerase
MREDRLRALRAIRFAARFEFTIDPATRGAIEASAPFLGRLSPERVKQELDKTLEQVRCPSGALETWRSTGAFATVVPALAGASTEALSVVDYLAQPGPSARPARRAIRFAAVLLGLRAKAAEDVLVSLRASRHETQAVATLIDRWHAHGPAIADALVADRRVADADVRRWVAGIGRLQIGSFMRLANAIWHAARARGATVPTDRAARELYRRMLHVALRDPIDLGSLAIDGDDLRRAGIPAGPGLGKILQALLTAVLEDPDRNTTDWLLREANRLYATSRL